jgi:hypothetical protein
MSAQRPAKKPRFTSVTTEVNGIKNTTYKEYASDDSDEEDATEEQFAQGRAVCRDFDKAFEARTKCSVDCYLCVVKFGIKGKKPKNKEIAALNAIYADNKDTTSQRQMAKVLAFAYVEKIQTPAIAMGKLDIMSCDEDQIYMHIKYHMEDMAMNIQGNIRDYTFLEEEFKPLLLLGGSKNDVDYVALNAYINLGAKKLAMIKALKDLQ